MKEAIESLAALSSDEMRGRERYRRLARAYRELGGQGGAKGVLCVGRLEELGDNWLTREK